MHDDSLWVANTLGSTSRNELIQVVSIGHSWQFGMPTLTWKKNAHTFFHKWHTNNMLLQHNNTTVAFHASSSYHFVATISHRWCQHIWPENIEFHELTMFRPTLWWLRWCKYNWCYKSHLWTTELGMPEGWPSQLWICWQSSRDKKK